MLGLLSRSQAASAPGSPKSPSSVVIQLGSAQLLVSDLLLEPNLPIQLILLLLADVEHIILWVRKRVIERPLTLHRGNLAGGKRIEVRFLFRGIGRHHFEACRRECVLLFPSRAAANRECHEHTSGQ